MLVTIPVSSRALPSVEARGAMLAALLEPVIAQSRILIRRYGLPPIYAAGVRWREEPWAGRGIEEFALTDRVLARGWGDCDDLVAARCAELREQGELAHPKIYWRPERRMLHAEVRRADGSVEDPSRILGMTRRSR